MSNYDSIIIGSGPEGISCAIYLKRFGLNPLVISAGMGALADAHKIENYYGIQSISGPNLHEFGIKQAIALGIPVLNAEVIDIELGDEYNVITKDGIYSSKTIMLALGTPRNKLSIASKFEGAGVSYCAQCDGFFYRNKKVAVIGTGEYMKHELNVLRNFISDITVFTNGKPLEVDVEGVNVVNDKISSFNGNEYLESITTAFDTYDVDGAFIALDVQSSFTFAMHLGIALRGNDIIVDSNLMTNLPGIFAGGDCIGGLKQIVKAASDGAIAAQSIKKYLKENK
jgi:thioredoxin reductase (NADPH)